jgi:hypothetical protein
VPIPCRCCAVSRPPFCDVTRPGVSICTPEFAPYAPPWAARPDGQGLTSPGLLSGEMGMQNFTVPYFFPVLLSRAHRTFQLAGTLGTEGLVAAREPAQPMRSGFPARPSSRTSTGSSATSRPGWAALTTVLVMVNMFGGVPDSLGTGRRVPYSASIDRAAGACRGGEDIDDSESNAKWRLCIMRPCRSLTSAIADPVVVT